MYNQKTRDSITQLPSHKNRRFRIVLALVLALVTGVSAGSYATSKWKSWTAGAEMPEVVLASGSNLPAGSLNTGFSTIVKSAMPSVVNIASSKTVRSQDNGLPFDDPFFRRFFGDQGQGRSRPQQRQRERSLGSGVIVSPSGYILTNSHVVDGASDVKVYLSDKRELVAKVVGTDPKTDVALIQVTEKNLSALPLGDSSKVQVGDIALAIGNPFGIGQTVTMGIVSATGRGNLGIEDYEDFIQTDAAINPGNSGGALIDSRGELIGINTAILSNGTRGNVGVGFAIPINMVRHVMDQILHNGKVVRGYLGVSIQEISPAIAKGLNLAKSEGALVGDVTPDSPAARAGLARGDVLLRLNGNGISNARELRLKISQTAPGTKVVLTLWKEGAEKDVTLTLGELPGGDKSQPAEHSSSTGVLDGLDVDNLTPEVARQLGLPSQTRGVVVTQVDPGTPAASAGLERGDVIQEVNRKPVASVSELSRAVSGSEKKPILLLVNHRGTTRFVVIEPQ